MVNTQNQIEGVEVDSHPLGDPGIYSQGPTYLAVQAQVGGVIKTRNGLKRFQAGDWILTDNPPTTAWTVGEQAFKNAYRTVVDPPPGNLPNAVPTEVTRAPIAKRQARGQAAAAKKAAETKAKTKAARPNPAVPGGPKNPNLPGREVTAGKIADSSSLLLDPAHPQP